jgi:predicted dehydrogenase
MTASVSKLEELRQRWPRPSKPQPIVIVGTGGIVKHAHLPAYARAGFRVAGLFDQRSEASTALASEFAVPRVFESLDEAVAEPGVVYDIAVPAGAVLEILERLPPRSAVLIQKPMGRDLDEALRILACCRRRELVAALNFQLRFSPNMLALRDAIDRNLLGAIADIEVRVNVHTPWELWDFLKGLPRHEILYHSIHYLDLIRSMFGEPRGVHARVVRNPQLPAYADTSSATILDYGDHRRCVLTVQHGHAFGERHMMSQLKIEGARGAAIARMGVNLNYPEGQADQLEFASSDSGGWQAVSLEGNWFYEAFEGPMSNLQRFVAGEDPVLETRVDDAARTMALVEACYRSSASGGTPIPELT